MDQRLASYDELTAPYDNAGARDEGLTGQRFRILNDVVFDPSRDVLFKDGAAIKLEPKQAGVLCALMDQANTIVGHDVLRRQVWGDVHVVDETLPKTMSLLRKALGDNHRNPRYIETVPGKGYRLMLEDGPTASTRPESSMGLDRRLVLAGLGGLVLGLALAAIVYPPMRPSVTEYISYEDGTATMRQR